jgi:hypothetical protein
MTEETREKVTIYRGGWLPYFGEPVVVVATGEEADGGLYAEYFAIFPDAGGEHWAVRLTISRATALPEFGINRDFVEQKAVLHAQGDINQRVYDKYRETDEKWPLPAPVTLTATEGIGDLVSLKLSGSANAALAHMRRLTQSRRLDQILSAMSSLEVAKMMPLN